MKSNIEKRLLGMLLDKYERSTSFRTGIQSTRRILIKLYDNGKGDLKEYNIELSDNRIEVNEIVKNLQDMGLLYFRWMKGEENHIISEVWLNVGNIDNVYSYLNRKPKNDILTDVCIELLNAVENTSADWAKLFLNETYQSISEKRTIGNCLPTSAEERNNLLKCICFAGNLKDTELLERVFSIRCFGNSKTFERYVRSRFVAILRKYLDIEEGEKDEEVLQQIGIVKYSEQIEFCGNITLARCNCDIDFSVFQYGVAIFSSEFSESTFIIPIEVDRIISIENRANYIDYIFNHKNINELVLYHGGQYSQLKKKFFELIAQGMSNKCRWVHWGDIDYGGFSMLARLRREINPAIEPYQMSISELSQHKEQCIMFDEAYGNRLNTLLNQAELSDCRNCIQYMILQKIKLEQEALL